MSICKVAAAVLCGVGCLASCGGKADCCAGKASADSVGAVADNGSVMRLAAVNRYLVDSIGSRYSPGDVCIPMIPMTCMDSIAGDSVAVWGDFWVYNYAVAGDTLKAVSGGSHPGKMTLVKDENDEWRVAAFEQVEDGSGNVESAKRIFGDKYDVYQAANSDEKYREKARAMGIADYVKEHNMAVRFYQDYGWPAREIPSQDTKAKQEDGR